MMNMVGMRTWRKLWRRWSIEYDEDAEDTTYIFDGTLDEITTDIILPDEEAKEEAKKAATKAQQNPDDDDLQAVFRVQIREILEADTELAKEITKILQTQKSDDSSSSVNAQAYDESTQFNTGRDVNNPTYDMRRINSPK